MIAGGIALWDANRKVQLLASLDFRIHDPGIPENVLTTIRNAELKAYDDMGLVRKAVEDTHAAQFQIMKIPLLASENCELVVCIYASRRSPCCFYRYFTRS